MLRSFVDAIVGLQLTARRGPGEPRNRLALVEAIWAVAGGGALRRIGPSIAEVKRLYVRPAYRRAGVGRRLLRELLGVARRTECDEVRLESPRFATDAHALYRALGFREIHYYSESECPPDVASECVFMSVALGLEDDAAV